MDRKQKRIEALKFEEKNVVHIPKGWGLSSDPHLSKMATLKLDFR